MDINSKLKNCKTSKEVYIAMCSYLEGEKGKYATILKSSLFKQKNFGKSLQLAYNYILNQDFPTKANDTAVVRWKGTSIHGMECHSPR